MSGSPVRQPTLNMPLDTTLAGAIPADLLFVPTITSTRDSAEIPGGSQDRTIPGPKD